MDGEIGALPALGPDGQTSLDPVEVSRQAPIPETAAASRTTTPIPQSEQPTHTIRSQPSDLRPDDGAGTGSAHRKAPTAFLFAGLARIASVIGGKRLDPDTCEHGNTWCSTCSMEMI